MSGARGRTHKRKRRRRQLARTAGFEVQERSWASVVKDGPVLQHSVRGLCDLALAQYGDVSLVDPQAFDALIVLRRLRSTTADTPDVVREACAAVRMLCAHLAPL